MYADISFSRIPFNDDVIFTGRRQHKFYWGVRKVRFKLFAFFYQKKALNYVTP